MSQRKSSLLTILQMSDSVFPTGGFSHSCGLEASERFGYVYNKETLKTFILSTLENKGSFCIPYVREAYNSCHDEEEMRRLDTVCEAGMSNHVANRASVRQGRALVNTSWIAFQIPALKNLQALIDANELRGHYAVVFGCICGYLCISQEEMLYMYMFGVLRTVVAAAVRLGSIGTLEAQTLQFAVQDVIPGIIKRYQDLPVDEAHLSFPIADVMQNSQDSLFSRLFYS